MADLATINTQFFLSLVIIGLGYLSKKAKILDEKASEGLAKVIINITLPSLILATISNIDLDFQLIIMPFICLIYSGIVAIIALKVFRDESWHSKGILLMTSLGFNIGLFAYPLIQGIFGDEGLVYVAMFDVGNAFIIFGLVYIIGSIYSQSEEEKEIDWTEILKMVLKNIPLISYIIALIINVGFGGLGGFTLTFFDTISQANKALVLLVLGLYLDFNIKRKNWKKIATVLLIRYAIGLLSGILLYFVLPFNNMFRTITLISLILPIGMAVIPFAIEFEYDDELVTLTGSLTNLTIVCSFVLMWLLLLIFNLG